MNKPLDIILNSVGKVAWRTLKDRLGFIDYNIAVIIKYNTEIEPFEYFIPISVGREAPLLPSIITYMEANKSVYLKLLNDISSVEELETLLYIILGFKRDPFIRECVYSAKNNEKNSIYNEIFESFIADIDEVHSL